MNNPNEPGKPFRQPRRSIPAPEPSSAGRRRLDSPPEEPTLAFGFLMVNAIIFVGDFLTNGRLMELGQKDNALILAGELWRFVTPMFLHYGIIHLIVNSYSLIVIGPMVERAFGHWRFAAIYLLSGFAGVVASFTFNRAFSAGASGALFGLIGALLPFYFRNRLVLRDTRRRIISVLQILGINLLISLLPGIDGWAHGGGLVAGLALGWFVTPVYRLLQDADWSLQYGDSTPDWLVWAAIAVIAVGIAGLAYASMMSQ